MSSRVKVVRVGPVVLADLAALRAEKVLGVRVGEGA